MMDVETRLLELLHRYGVSAVLFVDSLSDAAVPVAPGLRATAGALRLRGDEVHRFLCNLAHAFDVMNIRSGSYGDRDGQSRERLAMMGAKICVAPMASGAASVARAWSDPVALPAAGVTSPGLHPDMPDPRDLISAGMCDALVSDGTPEMLMQAALHLDRSGALPIAGAWSLISSRPAQVLGAARPGQAGARAACRPGAAAPRQRRCRRHHVGRPLDLSQSRIRPAAACAPARPARDRRAGLGRNRRRALNRPPPKGGEFYRS